MSINETIEYFPIFDPQTTNETPGISVAIGTGVAAIGTPDALGGQGAVVLYVYSAAKNAWGYVGVLTGGVTPGSGSVRALGSSCVAFGDTVIIGAKGDAETPGRVFVLTPPYGTWTYAANPVIAQLACKEPAKGDFFGASVAHCSDGTDDYVAVGAPGAVPPRGVSGLGQVFIFRGLDSSNTPWSTSSIANPDAAGGATDQFGASIAINPSGDGSGKSDGTLTLAVGAPGAGGGKGAVYVGRTSEQGTWTSPFKFGEPLVPTFPAGEGDFKTTAFGTSIALTGGVTLAVGSPNDPNVAEKVEDTGAVWIFRYTDGSFVANEAGASLYGSAGGRKFGSSVAFLETDPTDGALTQASHLFVGAPGAVEGQPACAYRYVNDAGTTFTEDAQYGSSSKQQGDRFGASVTGCSFQHGSWCLVGVPGNPKAELEKGGYLYVDGEPHPTWMDTPPLLTDSQVRWGGQAPDWWARYTPKIPKYLE